MTPRGWIYAAVGLLAVAAFLALPVGGLGQVVVLVGAAWALTVVVIAEWVTYRRMLPRFLLFLAAGLAIYAIATTVWAFGSVNGGLPYPSFLDVVYWIAYLLWASFLVGLTRMSGRLDRSAALDALIVAIALMVLGWQVLLAPAMQADDVAVTVRFAGFTYVILLLLLATLAARIVTLPRRFTVASGLLAAWLVLELTADVWYSMASADGTFYFGSPWMVAWLLAMTSLAALTGSHGWQTLSEPRDRPVNPAAVITVLTICALVPVLVLLAMHDTLDERVVLVLDAVLMVTLVLRISTLYTEMTAERALREETAALGEELAQVASHDALTGLWNRAAFETRLERLSSRKREEGRVGALIVVDLDAFKAVNDRYGHSVGDDLLRTVAGRLSGLVRGDDFVVRLGGDEFAVLVDDTDPSGAVTLTERVSAKLHEPVDLNGTVLRPGASVGLRILDEGLAAGQATIEADAAMYSAKAEGGGSRLFDARRDLAFLDRQQLEFELRAAPEAGELILHYQPIVNLGTRRFVGVEALVRWDHPERGLLYPAAFIDLAEETGAILELGRWVLHQGSQDAVLLAQALADDASFGMSINVSRRQLASSGLDEDVKRALAASGLEPEALSLEVTETAMVDGSRNLTEALQRLKAIGVQLAMDDFGTGYSSLSQLRTLPIDVLKIDRAFVAGIARGKEEWSLATSIVRLARSLGKATLAEGVEDAGQMAHLRSLGCEYAQGYLFARPMPFDDVKRFLVDQAVSASSQ